MGLKIIDGTPSSISKFIREKEEKENGCLIHLTDDVCLDCWKEVRNFVNGRKYE